MEFEYDYEIETKKTKIGKEIRYAYKFKGTDESNKTSFVLKTEQKLDLVTGAIINIDFTNTQTKVQ